MYDPELAVEEAKLIVVLIELVELILVSTRSDALNGPFSKMVTVPAGISCLLSK